MIQSASTPELQTEFLRRIAHKPYFESTLGTHLHLFGSHPASGWAFYLLPGSAVLELRGGSAVLCGALPGGEAGEDAREELTGFLRFLHADTLRTEHPMILPGWQPAAPLTLNDEQTTLEFAGLDFAIYNLQLDGLTSLADGETPEQKNVLLTLNVAATDEASSVSRQSWNWEAAPASARSQTHSLDLSGKASTLTLTASGYTGEYRSYPLNAQLTRFTPTPAARWISPSCALRSSRTGAGGVRPAPGRCRVGRTPT